MKSFLPGFLHLTAFYKQTWVGAVLKVVLHGFAHASADVEPFSLYREYQETIFPAVLPLPGIGQTLFTKE